MKVFYTFTPPEISCVTLLSNIRLTYVLFINDYIIYTIYLMLLCLCKNAHKFHEQLPYVIALLVEEHQACFKDRELVWLSRIDPKINVLFCLTNMKLWYK